MRTGTAVSIHIFINTYISKYGCIIYSRKLICTFEVAGRCYLLNSKVPIHNSDSSIVVCRPAKRNIYEEDRMLLIWKKI